MSFSWLVGFNRSVESYATQFCHYVIYMVNYQDIFIQGKEEKMGTFDFKEVNWRWTSHLY